MAPTATIISLTPTILRLAIGTLGRTILEISLSDNLAAGDTRHIDIRLRQNNRSRPADSGGVAPVVQAAEDAPAGNVIAAGPAQAEAPVQPGNQAASPPGSRPPSSSSRLKITVAADESDPEDADEKYLDKMRGWLMTVATLVVGITFQAAIQPPDWVKRGLSDGEDKDRILKLQI
nr:unnamed protein product [Digitaria exilis]